MRFRIWNTATRQLVRELPSHEYRVHDVALSLDDKYLATGCGEHAKGGWAKVWDVTTGEMVFQREFKNTVKSVAFSPDPEGGKLVAGSSVLICKWGAIKVWDWGTSITVQTANNSFSSFSPALMVSRGSGTSKLAANF